MAISPDGTWLATAGGRTVQVWAADGTLLATLTGRKGWVGAMAISPDGAWLAVAEGDGTVRIWAAKAAVVHDVTALRIDDTVSDCAWFPHTMDLCIVGGRGIYRFSLRPPSR